MALSLVAPVDNVELAEGAAVFSYRQIVSDQVNITVLLEKELPELFEVDSQPFPRLLCKLLQ